MGDYRSAPSCQLRFGTGGSFSSFFGNIGYQAAFFIDPFSYMSQQLDQFASCGLVP
jgi:hypothetical protein